MVKSCDVCVSLERVIFDRVVHLTVTDQGIAEVCLMWVVIQVKGIFLISLLLGKWSIAIMSIRLSVVYYHRYFAVLNTMS